MSGSLDGIVEGGEDKGLVENRMIMIETIRSHKLTIS